MKQTFRRAMLIITAFLIMLAFIPQTRIGFAGQNGDDYIKWVDCNVSYATLKQVYDLDVRYHGSNVQFRFADTLAYLATKNGNVFSKSKDQKHLKELIAKLEAGETTDTLLPDNRYYRYHKECFTAIFKEFIGEYITDEDRQPQYGLKAYFPFAKGYWMSHYDDFGNSRSYGFKRKHLGHDMMGSIGTPIIAVEGGTVTELGWNKYGGWRVGILSKDKQRYYYYAHLRKDRPFAEGLKAGDHVSAGEVVGYLGRTGYSNRENVNLKTGSPHLHIGLQLIFDESQIKGSKEIWIDLYAITNFLAHNKASVIKNEETKEYASVHLRHGIAGHSVR